MKASGYDLISYGNMVRCEPRMSAYAAALRAAVTPGCTVIDIGAGPGVFALLACQYGAGKVVAIEPDPSIGLLHQFARDNDYADRIEVIQGTSSDYHPTEKADVIVSDLRGGMPLYEGHIGAIQDARERLLKPGGILIPGRDRLYVAAVESAASYREIDEPWRGNNYGVNLSAGTRFAANCQTQVDLTEEVLLGSPQLFGTLDYRMIVEPNLHSKVALSIERAGTIHGLLMWFDAEIADGLTYSNAPGQPPQVYRQLFCPLERPVAVAAGDTLHAEIKANLIDGSYVWSWNTSRARGADGAIEPLFRQSTFLATILQPSQLAARADGAVPARKQEMAIDAAALALVDGERSLGMIAEAVMAQHPGTFTSFSEGLDHVTRLAGRYATQD